MIYCRKGHHLRPKSAPGGEFCGKESYTWMGAQKEGPHEGSTGAKAKHVTSPGTLCLVRCPSPSSRTTHLFSGGLPCAIGVASLARPAPPRAFEQQRAVQPRAKPSGYRASHHRSPAKPTIGQSASFASRSSPHDLPFDCRFFSAMSEGAHSAPVSTTPCTRPHNGRAGASRQRSVQPA